MTDRLTSAEINLAQYRHNISMIQSHLGTGVHLMAIIKANAYGHGIEHIAKAASEAGATHLGVVSLGELKQARSAVPNIPILLINYIDAASISEALAYKASITVMDLDILTAIEAAAQSANTIAVLHIKIDTGMHRAGCDPSEVLAIAQKIENSPYLKLDGIFTHLAESEDPDSTFTILQLDTFRSCIAELASHGVHPPLIHCANSAATIAYPESHFTMVRPGIITYGINPFPKGHLQYQATADTFQPILTLKTRVIHTRTIAAGESVGYNRRWQAKRPSTIALIPVGYGDGYRRTPHGATHVLIHGTRAPIIGSIAMDQTVVDITDITKTITIGDEVVLIGTQNHTSITIDDIASMYQTINYEVVTSLAARVERRYVS